MPDKYAKTRKRWMATKLDRFDLSMPKGKKDIIKAHAASVGESMNTFINRAVDEAIARDMKEGTHGETGNMDA